VLATIWQTVPPEHGRVFWANKAQCVPTVPRAGVVTAQREKAESEPESTGDARRSCTQPQRGCLQSLWLTASRYLPCCLLLV
jgi:hypothetical protein